jgi:hypothetical protein
MKHAVSLLTNVLIIMLAHKIYALVIAVFICLSRCAVSWIINVMIVMLVLWTPAIFKHILVFSHLSILLIVKSFLLAKPIKTVLIPMCARLIYVLQRLVRIFRCFHLNVVITILNAMISILVPVMFATLLLIVHMNPFQVAVSPELLVVMTPMLAPLTSAIRLLLLVLTL